VGMALAAAAVVLTFAGCASNPDNQSRSGYTNDPVIASQVKDALKGNPDYKYDDVQVASSNGTVQLSGTVKSAWLKVNATAIALQVQGVKNVDNNLAVKDNL
jgi:hyperosmotically inducible periplasmic protein